jgi:hypothetical protein
MHVLEEYLTKGDLKCALFDPEIAFPKSFSSVLFTLTLLSSFVASSTINRLGERFLSMIAVDRSAIVDELVR